MRNKMKYFVLIIVLICVAVTGGLYERNHHPDYLREYYRTGEAAGFQVTYVLPESDAADIVESETALLQNADYIFTGEMCGMPDGKQNSILYPLKVLSVYRGDALQEGETIQYVLEAVFSSREKSWYGSFTNLLKEGKRYLFFAKKDARREDTYLSIEGDYIHYFCLDMDMAKDYVDAEKYKEQNGFYDLESVKDNEFFVENETVLNQVNEMKRKMLQNIN